MNEAREAIGGWAWVGLGGLATLIVPLWLLLTASFVQFDQFFAIGETPADGDPVVVIEPIGPGAPVELAAPEPPRPVLRNAVYWANVALLFTIPVGLGLGLLATLARLAMDRRAAQQRMELDARTRDDAVLDGVEIVTKGRSGTKARGPALVLADMPTRTLAFLVDAGLVLVAAAPLIVLNPAVLDLVRPDRADVADQFAGRVLGISVLLVMIVAIVQLVGELRTGQSIGKRWFGIRIAVPSGDVPNALQLVFFRRWTIVALAMATAWVFFQFTPGLAIVGALSWPVIDGLAWLGPDRRALHDQWAGTVVVKAATGT